METRGVDENGEGRGEGGIDGWMKLCRLLGRVHE